MFRGEDSSLLQSQRDAQTSDVTVTGTTNASLPGLSVTVQVLSTADVWLVDLDVDVLVVTNVAGGGNNTTNIAELLVDGASTGPQIITGLYMDGSIRTSGHQRYRVTGLTVGSHTFTARTRNTLSSTDSTVRVGNSALNAVPGP